MLIVTNGDSAAGAMREAGIRADILPWRDVLHDGPVPPGLPLAELSLVRARFLASRGWGEAEELAAEFSERDRTLERFREFDEVVLWFEHDLYDQLQLLQVLDWFAQLDAPELEPGLVCRKEFITSVAAADLPERLRDREPVGEARGALAAQVWSAFRAPDPVRLAALAAEGTSALPHLGPALGRLLEELPDARSGLSRTERQILQAVEAGARTPLAAFRATAEMEEAMFLGDASFLVALEGLATGPRPPLRADPRPPSAAEGRAPGAVDPWFRGASLDLSKDGRRMLAGELDRVEANGVDRWLGGLHLRPGTAWRWDAARRRPLRP